MVTPTQKPVPSNVVTDLLFNSEKMDEVINSESYEYVDRLGKNRRTLAGIERDANRAMSNYGYITKDSFEEGTTLLTSNTVLRWRYNGEYYRWDGDWSGPKVVPAGSTPMSTGGIGEGAWIGVGDAALRQELAESNGGGIGIGGGRTLKDKVDESKTVGDYGVTGRSDDESQALQLAVDSGRVIVPDGMVIRFSSLSIPPGTAFEMGENSVLKPTSQDAMKFQTNEVRPVTGDVAVGGTVVPYSGTMIDTDIQFIKIIRVWTATDAWYVANAENKSQLGYTSDVFLVDSVSETHITLKNKLPFELNFNSFLQILSTRETVFTGGSIDFSGIVSNSNWVNLSRNVSNINFHRVSFILGGWGIRFNASHAVNAYNCKYRGGGKGGSLFFGYGSTDCTVTYSEFFGGLASDGQLIAYAGCRNVCSIKNTFIIPDDVGIKSGCYFGAKTIGCKSIDDSVTGSYWGVLAMFGAQNFQLIRPILKEQNRSAIFVEKCQSFSIVAPDIEFDGSGFSSNDDTWGAIMLKACDEPYVSSDGVMIKAKGRLLNVFNDAAASGIVRRGMRINVAGSGDVRIAAAIIESTISAKIPGYAIDAYQAGNVSENVDIIDCIAASMSINAMAYSRIKRNKIVGDASTTGIRITGGESCWNDIDDNILIDHATGVSIPNTDKAKFSNNIGGGNQFKNVTDRLPVFVSSDDKPVFPYVVSRVPVRGFVISVNSHFLARNNARTALGFRHSGSNGGRGADWHKILITEAQMPD